MLIIHCCQPLVLIFQFFKIFEQRTSSPPKFESQFHELPHIQSWDIIGVQFYYASFLYHRQTNRPKKLNHVNLTKVLFEGVRVDSVSGIGAQTKCEFQLEGELMEIGLNKLIYIYIYIYTHTHKEEENEDKGSGELRVMAWHILEK